VRVALATTVLALTVATAPVAAGASTPNPNPTRAQIRTAIKRAESSTSLWATVNICNSKAQPHTIGIRGQMPTLGFPAWLSMKITLNYWDTNEKRFTPVSSNGTRLIRLGRWSTNLQQGGWSVQIDTGALLNATVQFFWRREGVLLGRKTLTTTAGHPGADGGSPPHYSAKECQLP
jgi:hypothetical protein